MTEQQTRLVDAIEDGKIVKVTEDYARKEGLLVLRKAELTQVQERKASAFGMSSSGSLAVRSKKEMFMVDKFRRPLRNENNVLSTLKDNFHWGLAKKRKQIGLTRKQAAQMMNCSEEELKMVENGILPADDYVLISKVQNFYKINLRKDGQDFTMPARRLVESAGAKLQVRGISRSFGRGNNKNADSIRTEEKKVEIDKKEKTDEMVGSDIEIIDDK